ncbi:MAG: hypothetical protein NW237_07460 [Cyanobacteriota bacterium]|nr:hypothetical protein [Cyanobacteriota bacterium]
MSRFPLSDQDLLQSARSFMQQLNWDNRVVIQPISSPEPHPSGIPTLLMDWSVEQFFASFAWTGIQLETSLADPIPEDYEDPFTLNDFSDLF